MLQNNGWTALAAEVSKLQHLMQAALLQAQKNGTALKAVNAKKVIAWQQTLSRRSRFAR
jgi:hypothetical protein